MARLTDQELKDLKDRALAAQISGARLANAEEHLFQLIGEVLELRKGAAPAAATAVTVKGELTVQKADQEKLPAAPEPEAEVLKKVDEPFSTEPDEPAKEPEEDDGGDEAPAPEPKAKKGPKRKK